MSAFFEVFREYDKVIQIFRAIDNECSPHFHSNIELMYVVSGKINTYINGNVKSLEKGCVSIANSYDIHSYCTDGESKIIVMIIPVELVNSFTTTIHSKIFSTSYIENSRSTKQIYGILEQLLNSTYSEADLIYKGCAYYILGILLNCVELIDKPSLSSTDLARKILLYLQQNYLKPLSISSLSKYFGYNKDYLSRFFNSYLGCGFNSYVNTLRSHHAAQLISNGNSDMTDIAYLSGFSNYRTFNRAFQKVYTMTPSEYKNRATIKTEFRACQIGDKTSDIMCSSPSGPKI